MLDAIRAADRAIFVFFRLLSLVLLCLLFVLMSLNVILRFAPVFSIGWFDEIVELSFAWMVFATAAVLWRRKQHPQIDFLEFLFEGSRCRHMLMVAIECVNIFFLSIFTYYGYLLVAKATATSPIFQIPRKIFYVAMPAAGLYMTIVSLFFLAGYLQDVVKFKKSSPIPNEKPV